MMEDLLVVESMANLEDGILAEDRRNRSVAVKMDRLSRNRVLVAQNRAGPLCTVACLGA